MILNNFYKIMENAMKQMIFFITKHYILLIWASKYLDLLFDKSSLKLNDKNFKFHIKFLNNLDSNFKFMSNIKKTLKNDTISFFIEVKNFLCCYFDRFTTTLRVFFNNFNYAFLVKI